LHLPGNTITAVAFACPALENLKLKYANLAPDHIIEIASLMPSLLHLSIGKCDVWFYRSLVSVEGANNRSPADNTAMQLDDDSDHDSDDINIVDGDPRASDGGLVSYSELVHFIASHLPSLQSLHFNQCTLHALPTSPSPQVRTRAPITHPLSSLKIFDISEHRPTDSVVNDLVSSFRRLHTLRMDVPASSIIPNGKGIPWGPGHPTPLPLITNLELRGAKNSVLLVIHPDDDREPTSPTTLRPSFPHANSVHAENLTRLKLNYLPDLPESLVTIPPITMPSLIALEIRAISITSHATCLALLGILVGGASRLRSLQVEALHRETALFPMHYWTGLVKSNQKLKSIKFTNFRLPVGALSVLSKGVPCEEGDLMEASGRFGSEDIEPGWPELVTFALTGQQCIEKVDIAWEESELKPFIETHRYLRVLRFTVGEIAIDGVRVGGEARRGEVELDIRGIDRWSDRNAVLRTHKIADMSAYRHYGESIKKRWWWLDEVVVLGPLSGVDMMK
ncbi:hypothetical protein HDU76_012449, partial [Blyttiomyces sp. JEL0837]